ncbi:hypothetical protein BBJ28_00017999 [Nothophytophthora sp. Chile5]|nr:hypothetical protein BBJ28_00017999 [Nothophytophthora sp. Chile5]
MRRLLRRLRLTTQLLLLTSLAVSAAVSAAPSTPSSWHRHLRRLTGTLVTVPTDPTFSWNGSTSDLAQQYYHIHAQGLAAGSMNFTTSDLPTPIKMRLEAVGLTFEQLPGLLQRAVIWDSGYTLDKDSTFIRVYTVGGVTMAKIAVSKDEYDSAGCTTTNCSDPDGRETFRSQTCSGDMMLSVSHCASQEVTVQGGHTSMWATGGDPDGTPAMEMVRHSWFDNVYLENYLVFAIHMLANVDEPAWETCPTGYGEIIVPCDLYSASKAATNDWKEPAYGELTTAWLIRTKQEIHAFFHLVFLVPILLGGVGLGVCLILVCRWRRRRMQLSKNTFYHADVTMISPAHAGSGGRGRRRDKPVVDAAQEKESNVVIQWSYGYPSSTSSLVRALISDPGMRAKRVPMEQLHFQRQLATGAFGEIWLCELESSEVAVKRLLKSRKQTFDDVQAFMDEIQLTASLNHPNVVTFLGVAWTTLENVCMVMEYLPNGDLHAFLRANMEKTGGAGLTWRKDKVHLAIDIARALRYLHARRPTPLIHRDIKARNVLLTDSFEAKLIDFGVSRNYAAGSCMTMGVGTPFWTAPEVLDGSVYSEQSDIYSFGVLLSELDTGASPYHDAKTTSRGSMLQPFHILKLVMNGCLQPNFSPTCPPGVQAIADLCLLRDPAQRPRAKTVVKLLERLDGPDLDEKEPELPMLTIVSHSSSQAAAAFVQDDTKPGKAFTRTISDDPTLACS